MKRAAFLFRGAVAAVVVAMSSLSNGFNSCAQSLRTISLTGDPSPDGDGVLDVLHLPVLNDGGWVAFESRTSGHSDLFHPEILIVGDGNDLIQIARGGFEDPINYRVPAFNELGQVAINGSSNILTTLPGPLRADTDGVTFLAQVTDADPDGVGTFETFGRLALNASGLAAFNGRVEIDSFTHRVGIYVSDGTKITSYVVDGQTVPGTTHTFTGFNLPSLNDAGWVTFLADHDGDDSGGGANEGVYLANGTSVEVLAHHGDTAPGGGVFREFLQPVINQSGTVAFHARLEGVGAGPWGIYLADTSSVVAVVLEDQPMPDGDGVLAVFNQPVLNDAGQVAFFGIEEGAIDRGNGIFLAVNGSLTEVVRANDPAPAGGGSFVFVSSGADYTPVINNRGQLAFRADFAIPRNSDEGIVFRDADGSLHLVARDGQPLAGSTVNALGLLGSDSFGLERDSGGRKALNDRGQVTFHATLADGREGIFLWTPPAPAGPRISLVSFDGADVIITIPSSAGYTYQLVRRGSLGSGLWMNEGISVAGTGENIEVRHVNGAGLGRQYYAVVETHEP